MSNAAPVRRALLIGIDAYERITKLEGCVNDVTLMRDVLQDVFGFDPANITMRTNAEATREGILKAFDAFVDSVGTDDIVVIHYAGHGSLMTDREGDEPSGYDSTMQPVDTEGWQGDNRDITDDEIHLRLARIAERTSYTTLIFDCCHSGTITRDGFGAQARSTPPDRRPVSELPPSPIPQAARGGERDSGPSGWLPLSGKYVLISGCRDEELSYEHRPPEFEGRVAHGALTYFLTRELRQATPGTTYRDVYERAAAQVSGANSRQHPQMEGAADREIFGIRDIEPMRFVRIAARDGANVTIAAGAALGITAGSVYEVHPQGTKSTDGAAPLGTIEVTEVGAVTSQARITAESTEGAIVADARAFETEHAYGDLRFPLQLVGEDSGVAALRTAIESSKILRLVDNAAAAAVRVYLIPPRDTLEEGTPVPQLGPLTEPTWAAVGEDGELKMPPKPLGEADVMKDNLEKLARYRQSLALDNPDPNSALRGRFTLELMRQGPDGAFVPAEPDPASGRIVYEEGDLIELRVTSHHDKPVYVNLLDFGLKGGVEPIFPEQGAGEKLREEGSFSVGPFELELPDAFPFAGDPVHGGAAEGTETVKLILTTGPADFSFLRQEGFRGGAASPLMMLWETAAAGPPTREMRKPKVPLKNEEDWTTVVKSFVLRRKTRAALNAGGEPLTIGSVSVSTPGLEGELRVHTAQGRAAAAEHRTGQLFGALEDAAVEVRQTIELADAREIGPATRSARGAPAVEIAISDPGPGFGQMVMTTDELGVISWNFAPPDQPAAGTRGGAAPGATKRTYLIPRAVPTATAEPGTRGLVGLVGTKLFKELVFPIIDPIVGAVSASFANRWEGKHRPYRVRAFGPDDYDRENAPLIEGDGWKRLGEGRALLLVHGTFSRAHTAFASLSKEFVESLHQRYDGRVVALDHFTLSHDPRQNVEWLLEHMPADAALDIDILCHSRGALVSRLLSEKQSEISLGSRRLRVGSVVFVGSPNAGTILADGSRIGDLLDTYTNLLSFIPDAGVSDVLAGVITVAKQLAVGAAGGLKGLEAMKPGGDFSKWLNNGPRAGETRYFALSSDFTPATAGLREFARNRLMDMVFKAPNDLVVPTDSVFAENGSGFFPIEERVVFTGADSVAHTGYFAKRAAREKIMEWLSSS